MKSGLRAVFSDYMLIVRALWLLPESRKLLLADPNLSAVTTKLVTHMLKTIRLAKAARLTAQAGTDDSDAGTSLSTQPGAMFTRALVVVLSLPSQACSRRSDHDLIKRVSMPLLSRALGLKGVRHGTRLAQTA